MQSADASSCKYGYGSLVSLVSLEGPAVTSGCFSILIGGFSNGVVDAVSSLTDAFNKGTSDAVSSCSTFLLFQRFPLGAGSSGVRQYVTVLVTTCLTLTLPGGPCASGLASCDSNEALQGAALSGVETYGEATVCAEPSTGEKGDCGM